MREKRRRKRGKSTKDSYDRTAPLQSSYIWKDSWRAHQLINPERDFVRRPESVCRGVQAVHHARIVRKVCGGRITVWVRASFDAGPSAHHDAPFNFGNVGAWFVTAVPKPLTIRKPARPVHCVDDVAVIQLVKSQIEARTCFIPKN